MAYEDINIGSPWGSSWDSKSSTLNINLAPNYTSSDKTVSVCLGSFEFSSPYPNLLPGRNFDGGNDQIYSDTIDGGNDQIYSDTNRTRQNFEDFSANRRLLTKEQRHEQELKEAYSKTLQSEESLRTTILEKDSLIFDLKNQISYLNQRLSDLNLQVLQIKEKEKLHQQSMKILERKVSSLLTKEPGLTEELTPGLSPELKRECVICMESEVDSAIIPCGHAQFCGQCIVKISECSICKQPKTGIFKLYL
jgi:hypothetical protein